MPKVMSRIAPYVDDKGKLRLTKTGHYRFDLVMTQEDGTPYFSVVGLRFDAARKRILPVTIVRGSSTYTVAEVAPEAHGDMVDILMRMIEEEHQVTG